MSTTKYRQFESSLDNPFEANIKQFFNTWFVPGKLEDGKKVLVSEIDEEGTVSEQEGVLSKLGDGKFYCSDTAQFIKTYPYFWEINKGLSIPALRVFGYIITIIKPNSGEITIEFNECMKYCEYKSKTNIYRALIELLEKNVIAKKARTEQGFWINVGFFFNGDRRKLPTYRELLEKAKNKK